MAREGKVYISFDLHIEQKKNTKLNFIQLTDSSGTTKTLTFAATKMSTGETRDTWGYNGGVAKVELIYDLETGSCTAEVAETQIGTEPTATKLNETQDFTSQVLGLTDIAKIKFAAPHYIGWLAYDNILIENRVEYRGILENSYQTDMSAWAEGMSIAEAKEALGLDEITEWSGAVSGLDRTVTAMRKTDVPNTEAGNVAAAFTADSSSEAWVDQKTAGIVKNFSATEGKVYINFDLHIGQKQRAQLQFMQLTDSKGTAKTLSFGAHKISDNTSQTSWGYNGGVAKVSMVYDLETGSCTAEIAETQILTEQAATALDVTQDFTSQVSGLADIAKIKFVAPIYIGWMAYDNISIENYVEDKGNLANSYSTDVSAWTEGMSIAEAKEALGLDEIANWSGTVASKDRTVTATRKTDVPNTESGNVAAAFCADTSAEDWIPSSTAGLVKNFSATDGKVYISFDLHVETGKRTQLGFLQLTDSTGTTKTLTFGAHTISDPSKAQTGWGINGGVAHVDLVYDLETGSCTAEVAETQIGTNTGGSALDETQDFTSQVSGLTDIAKIKFAAPVYIGWIAYDNISIKNYVPHVEATGVEIEESGLTLQEGLVYQLDAAVLPENATKGTDVIWHSSATSIAKVDENGKVTAVGTGSAVISAVLKSNALVYDSISVTVKELKEEISVQIADNNKHRYPSRYLEFIEEFYEDGTQNDRKWSSHAWKNDHVTSRIDIFTKAKSYNGAKLVVSDFVSHNGTISKDYMSATFMRDIQIDHNNEGVVIDERVSDIITHDSVKSLEGSNMYSAWVDLYIPASAAAGVYTGTVELQNEDGGTLAVCTYEIDVLDKTLPEEFTTPMELWTSPYTINRYFSGKTSNEYFGVTDTDKTNLVNIKLDPQYDDALRESLKLYKKAGGTAITVTIVESAWGGNFRPDPYPSMVKWTKTEEGNFSFDYTDLDKWVEMNMEEGIDKQIKSFSMASWGNTITYYDEATQKVVQVSPSFGSDEWTAIWTPFLTDYCAHMKSKGWLDKTYIAIDERPVAEVKEVLDLVEAVNQATDSTLKVSLAINVFDASEEAQAVYDRVADISLTDFLPNYYPEFVESRMNKGLMTTVYDCGKGAGTTLCYPGDSAYTLYHSNWAGVDGYLRWALDYYNDDPLNSTVLKGSLGPGDANLIYPSERDAAVGERYSQSSPRFEKYIEGMRELEKIKILKEEYPDYVDDIDELLQMTSGIKAVVNNGVDLTAEKTNGNEAKLVRDGLYAIAKDALDEYGGLSVKGLSGNYLMTEETEFTVEILKEFKSANVSCKGVTIAEITPVSGQTEYPVTLDCDELLFGENIITVTVVYDDDISRVAEKQINVLNGYTDIPAYRTDMSAWTDGMTAEDAKIALGLDAISGITYNRTEASGEITINVTPQRGLALNKRANEVSLAFCTDQYNDKQVSVTKSVGAEGGKVLINFEYYVERAINNNVVSIVPMSGNSQTFSFNLQDFAWNKLSVLLDLDNGTYIKSDYLGETTGSLSISSVKELKFLATPYSTGAIAGFDNIEILPYNEHAVVSANKTKVAASNIASEYDLFVASYSGNKMISCKKTSIDADIEISYTEMSGFVTDGADTVKAFLWNNEMKPICHEDEASLTK